MHHFRAASSKPYGPRSSKPAAPPTTTPKPLAACARNRIPREQLARFRALRRRLLAAPDDSRLQAGLEDAAYTLCG
ncbi:DUF5133 domain-containing protein [Streptomyces sp. NPDC046876]|uniref:DUF5133 domain-containing protein n=1 Tax=Streptomyces sp. NPDC046876 TaxID=3155616 RepID=UPI0033E08C3E